MKIYENGKNWLIEDQLDSNLVKKINDLIDNNLNNLLKLKKGYSTSGEDAHQYWLIKKDGNSNFCFHRQFLILQIRFFKKKCQEVKVILRLH